MTASDGISITVAQTPQEAQRIRASSRDLSTYPHVSVLVAADPDNPAAVITNVHARPDAPCWLQVAKSLRDIAGELERRHIGSEGREGRCPD